MTSQFRVALSACCLLCKADIPEVEAVKRLLEPLIRDRFEEVAALVLEEIRRRLALLPARLPAPGRNPKERERVLRQLIRDIVRSLTLEIERVFAAPLNSATQSNVDEAVVALMAAGGSLSGDLDVGSSDFAFQSSLASQELSLLLQGIMGERLPAISELLTETLADEVARSVPNLLGAPTVADQQLARLLAPGRSVSSVVDSWAYRTFNIGTFAAANLDGVIGYRLQATLDGRQTAFCGWVNGRVVPISRVRKQLAARQQAILWGSYRALVNAQPFLDPEVAKNGSALEFEQFFRKAALPGYHWGCRTTSRPVRDV